MKFLASISFLASLAGAVSVDLARRDSPLEVKLEMVGNTVVKASITNNGNTDLKIFKTGSILDSTPVEKVGVFQASALPPLIKSCALLELRIDLIIYI